MIELFVGIGTGAIMVGVLWFLEGTAYRAHLVTRAQDRRPITIGGRAYVVMPQKDYVTLACRERARCR